MEGGWMMPSLSDFEKPFFGLKRQGTDANPKEVTLVVIGWQPKGKGEPELSTEQLEKLFFGETDSIAHWFQENSQGRYRLVPHPTLPIIGPFESNYPWPFYWRGDPNYVRKLLCGNENSFCTAWEQNPYKVPPPEGDPHRYVHPNGKVYYLDDENYTGGHTHSWAEAIRKAADKIEFNIFNRDSVKHLSVDEALVVIVKAQSITSGTRRPVTGSDVPITDLEVDGVIIKDVCELYAGPPHGTNDLAVGVEEVLHLAANLADQYPDGINRRNDDPGRPGQLALTDAGHRPVHIDPYHKLKWGWLNPQLADHSGTYTLRDAGTTGDALILFSPYFGIDEFFILENRWRGSSYDKYRTNEMMEGLALWHCIQDPNLSNDWARRAVHLRRASPNLDDNGNIQWSKTLFDGNDPERGYDLTDESTPQNLRFHNGMPSRIRIKNISPSGPTMSVYVDIPPKTGDIIATKGKIVQLRVHERGTGYGPPQYRINEDCIVKIDSQPGAAFGLDLSGANRHSGKQMFDLLRKAFQGNRTIRIEFREENALGGRIIRVIKSH
jgi:hypothetical protein